MRRAVAIVAAVGLVPALAWTAASAGPEPPVDCVSPTTSPGGVCVEPAPAAAVEPVQAEPTTSVAEEPPATAPPTTAAPSASEATTTTAPSTTVSPSTVPPSTVPSSSVSPSSVDPGVPSSSVSPSSVVDPGVASSVPSTSVGPGVVSSVPVEDADSEPVAPPVEAPSGRVVVPAGAVESGQVRPIAFPVAGPVSFVNDWGACRDGCARAHKGNDLIGDRLQPILAMHDGVVDHLVDHPTAGFGVVIRDEEGWEYHVYHMNNDRPGTDDGGDGGGWRFAPGVVAGAEVSAGQLIGWMGDSGNSEGSVPHAHVEIHTPSGAAINPYWSLRAAQRAANCKVGTVGQPLPSPAGQPAADPAVNALTGAQASAQPALAATTESSAAAADPVWLADGWSRASLPAGWSPFTVTGGRPGSDRVAARFWISQLGFTPVDAAALRVGDPRYDDGVDCATAEVQSPALPAEMAAILATIRHMESGGNYTVSVTTSSASGAYGFLDSSWGGYGGYARAKDAPPAVQDAKAAEFAASILARNGGDVSTVPVTWYIGHVPVGDEWDTVPRPDAGNRITPREYQRRWLNKYRQLLADPSAVAPLGAVAPVAASTAATCHTVVVDVGTPQRPQYLLTLGQSFLAHPDGRAVPDATDACDPGRVLSAAPAAAPAAPAGLTGGETTATLDAPPRLTHGPR